MPTLNKGIKNQAVKFPDGVEAPDEYKPEISGYGDYIYVESFEKVWTLAEFRVDGFQGNFNAMPCAITLSEPVMAKIKPLLNKPLKPDWEVKLVEFAKEDEKETDIAYKCEFEGVVFHQTGPTSIYVIYNKFESEKFKPKGAPDRDGYDFLKGQYLG